MSNLSHTVKDPCTSTVGSAWSVWLRRLLSWFSVLCMLVGMGNAMALATSTVSLGYTPNPLYMGSSATFTAYIGQAPATGTVSFKDGATVLATVAVSAGKAIYVSKASDFVTTGVHSMTAVYSGDTVYAGSTSLVQSLTLQMTPSTTAATGPVSGVYTQDVPYAVTVSNGVTGLTPAAIPTGKVWVYNGSGGQYMVLGSAQLGATGTATVNARFPLASNFTMIWVKYDGDANYSPSNTQYLAAISIAKAPNTLTLASSANPVQRGAVTALTATVSNGGTVVAASGGLVTYKDGATTLGTAILGVPLNTAFTTVGTHNLTATYAGDANFLASTSAAMSQSVLKQTSTATLSLAGGVTTTRADVAKSLYVAMSPTTTTGSVTFYNGATALGTATLNASGGAQIDNKLFTQVGTQQLTVVYAGDANYTTATSPTFALTVTQGQTSLATALSPVTVAAGVNETITVTVKNVAANATMTTAGGMVTLKEGTTTLGTASVVNGVATLSSRWWTTGAHNLSYTYTGDPNFAGSTYSPALQVNTGTTSTALTSSVGSISAGQSLTLTATVSPAVPSGFVTFYDGATSLNSAAVVNGVASLVTSFASAGTHSLTAVFSANPNFTNSTSAALSQTVIGGLVTQTTLTSSANPIGVGQSQTQLTATIKNAAGTATYGAATGTVKFYDGTTLLSTVTPSGGQALFATNFLTAGAHSLTAVYSGDATYGGNTSVAVTQNVTAAATTTTLTSVSSPVLVGQSTNIQATVRSITSVGNVTFKDGATTIGTAAIVLGADASGVPIGVATLTTTYATTGAHSISAVFNGNASYLTSTSPAVGPTVNPGPTTTVLASSVNPATTAQSTTLSATVSPAAATGTVAFKDGATTLGTTTVNAGVAVLTTSFATAGTHSLTAVFTPAANYTASTSAALSQTVNAASKVASSITLSASPDFVVSGTTVTLNAVVSGSAPTGTVIFSDAGVAFATAAVSAAQATTTRAMTGAGMHVLTAAYSGDAANLASASNTAGVNVSATVTSPGNMTWLHGYDANGNRWTTINPLGQDTDVKYDKLDRPTQLTQPPKAGSAAPTITSMAYDGQGNVTKVTDPRNLATSYTVTGLQTTTALASPDTGATGYTYDAAGNVLSKTDSRAKLTTYTYDGLNRIKSASYALGTATQLEYDGGATPPANSKGHLTKITDESGSTTYTYDALGRVLSKTQVAGTKTLKNSYTWGTSGSAMGRLTSITYPSGTRVNYSYDAFGRASAVTLNPVNANGVGTNTASTLSVLSGIGYDGAGATKGWAWANGVAYQRTYDSFGRLSSYPLGNPGGTGAAAGLTRTLTYDAAAQIKNYTHSNSAGTQAAFDQAFSYDNLGHLVSQTLGGTTYAYSYDATGNRTLRTVSGTGTANTIASTSNISTQLGTSALTYDAAGNLAVDNASAYTYATSARGRTSSATIGANVVSYLYNGLEQRVSKVGPTALVPSGAAYYAYDEAGQLVGEYDTNLAPLYETVYLGSTPVAVLKLTGAATTVNLQVNLYNVYADHIDTPRVITRSADQAIVWRWDASEAFGASAPDQNPNALGVFTFNQRFPGQVLDQETGNFYNWNRYYRPTMGSYAQSDPIGLAGGINTFGYVGGNPVSRVDPRGLETPDISLGQMPNLPNMSPQNALKGAVIATMLIPVGPIIPAAGGAAYGSTAALGTTDLMGLLAAAGYSARAAQAIALMQVKTAAKLGISVAQARGLLWAIASLVGQGLLSPCIDPYVVAGTVGGGVAMTYAGPIAMKLFGNVNPTTIALVAAAFSDFFSDLPAEEKAAHGCSKILSNCWDEMKKMSITPESMVQQ